MIAGVRQLGVLMVLTALPVLSAFAPAPPPRPVVFSREVLPLLNRACASCHRGSAAPGGYSLESAERLLAGGRHGRAVVAGKPAESTLLRYLTGDMKPQMPPGKPLSLDAVEMLRRWIREGARIDAMTSPAEKMGVMRDAMPRGLRPTGPSAQPPGRSGAVRQAAPATTVAFSPDNRMLAVGGYRTVRLLDPHTGLELGVLPGPIDQVLGVAWSADGKVLAAAGGVAGVSGQLCLWDVPAPGGAWGRPRLLVGHADAMCALAWRPGTQELATVSPDRTVLIWDPGLGVVVRTLRDHLEAVMAVAYSADGKWLATGSLDRTVRLYDATTGARVNSFANPEGVTALAFAPRSDLLAACADRQVAVWPVKAGGVENPLRSQSDGEAITSAAFSPDGLWFAWGAANRRVRLWNGDVSGHRRELVESADWVYAVAFSPDSRWLAAGGADGKVYLWTPADGKLVRTVAPRVPGEASQ